MSRRKMNWDRVRVESRSRVHGSERVEPDKDYKAYLSEYLHEDDEVSEEELARWLLTLPDEVRRAFNEAASKKTVRCEHPATQRRNAAIERFFKTGLWEP